MATVMKPSVEEPKSTIPNASDLPANLGFYLDPLSARTDGMNNHADRELIFAILRKSQRYALSQCDHLWEVSL